ncbi:MAG: pyridoxamine 5'-phosphate oxidase [Alphaproteobacteria bacterium]|nr:pyridoxamine 5'-phosphate oxidase [Alphaproteobacteria bacterium]QQS56732.1 MAG: pyridoxamine 5'-phosphate oxidase [Alphaproteobacteria bacterium]
MDMEKDTLPSNPLLFFHKWYEEAQNSEPNDPDAMALATANEAGAPRVRMVLLKQADERGFKFHSNEQSFKGRHLAENPRAALCFHWKSLRRQVCVEGTVEKAPDGETDEYFATRPYDRQIGAWASNQSRPLESRNILEDKFENYAQKYPKGESVPRPPYWSGYILKPDTIEFWWSHPDRLHDRFQYRRTADGLWTIQRLYP